MTKICVAIAITASAVVGFTVGKTIEHVHSHSKLIQKLDMYVESHGGLNEEQPEDWNNMVYCLAHVLDKMYEVNNSSDRKLIVKMEEKLLNDVVLASYNDNPERIAETLRTIIGFLVDRKGLKTE